jgi:elongation factor P--beta-lysine ligase
MTMLRRETLRLQVSMQRYTGEDLTSLRYEDLDQLEKELERSVKKVRDRKVFVSFLIVSITSPAFRIQITSFSMLVIQLMVAIRVHVS